jgi:hypothetical protein
MLKTFATTGIYMSIEQAQYYDQRPFRSMLIQGWIAYRPGRGFHVTPEGKKAYEVFHHTEIARKNPLLPLTSYFDPTQYGLKQTEKTRLLRAVAS